MKSFLQIIGILGAWLGVVIITAAQSTFGGVWLLIPIHSVLVFFLLLRFGLTRGVLAAIVVGFALDSTYPFPFGTFLLSYLCSVFVTMILFRTIFSHDMSIATIFGVGFGSILSDILAIVLMHGLFLFLGSAEVLKFNLALLEIIALRGAAASLCVAFLVAINNLIVRRIFNTPFTTGSRHAARL